MTWGLALVLPPVPPGLGLSPWEARLLPFVYPLLQLGPVALGGRLQKPREVRRAFSLAAWAFLLAEAGLYYELSTLPGDAKGSLAGLLLLSRPFFLLVGGLFLAFGGVLAFDPPPPNPRFGAVSPRGLADPAFWEATNRAAGGLMLVFGLALAGFGLRLSFFAGLGLILFALALVQAVPYLWEQIFR